MTKHPVETAFADPTTADQIKQSLAEGFALTRATTAEIPDLDLTGLTVLELIVAGRVFTYDPADSTSEHDDVTTLVSQDGRRFKSAIHPGAFTNVLSIVNDPPATPTIGDKHIVGAAPTGDFAAHANDLVVRNGADDWEFAAPIIGQRVYVRDIAEDRQWSEAGAWAQLGVTDGSVGAAQMQFPFGMVVESQTATPPGGTPAEGTKWIVGANATGAWDDWDGDIAEADGAGGFRRLIGYNGATVYDRALRVLRTFDGATGAWLSAGGVIVGWKRSFTAGNGSTIDNGGTSYYNYSSTTAPTTSRRQRRDQVGVSYAARAAGAKLVISYDADIQCDRHDTDGSNFNMALWRDSELNAIAWCRAPVLWQGLAVEQSFHTHVHVEFEVDAPDAAAHAYQISFLFSGDGFQEGQVEVTEITRRLMQVKEASA